MTRRAGTSTMTDTPIGAAPVVAGPALPAEQRLLLALAAWSAWSVGVGAVMWRVGRRDGERNLGDAGRTTLAWGLADAAVAGWGAWRERRVDTADPAARARRMALVTGANALLDVGYVTAGAAMATRSRRRGDGLAVAVQGGFLLYLDVRYSLEFAAAARRGSGALISSAETEQPSSAPRLGPCTRPASSTSPGGRGRPGGE